MGFKISLNIVEMLTERECKPSLQEKVDYAIDCMASNHNRWKAFEFLVELHEKLMKLDRLSHSNACILLQLRPIITRYAGESNKNVNFDLEQYAAAQKIKDKTQKEPY